MSPKDYLYLLVMASFLLQVISLMLLPKWWKAAACPTLPVLLVIVFDISAIDNSSGNLAGVVTEIFLAPLTIGYLSIVLALFGIAKAVQAGSQSHDSRPECQKDQDTEDTNGGPCGPLSSE